MLTAHVIFMVFAFPASVFGFLTNLATIYILVVHEKLKIFTYVIMLNICICDIVLCALTNPVYIANILIFGKFWGIGDVLCRMFKSISMAAVVAEIISLVAISYDRMKRVTTHTYKDQLVSRHGTLAVIGIWAFAITVCGIRAYQFSTVPVITNSFPQIENGTFDAQDLRYACKPWGIPHTHNMVIHITIAIFAFLVPLMIMCINYMRAAVAMRRASNRVAPSIMRDYAKRREIQISITMFLSSVIFITVWAPFFIMTLLDLTFPYSKLPIGVTANFSIRCTLTLISCCYNPVLYFFRMKYLRRRYISMLPCNAENESMTTMGNSRNDTNATKVVTNSGENGQISVINID